MDLIIQSMKKFTKSYLYFIIAVSLALLLWCFDMPLYGILFASIFLLIAATFSDNLIQLPVILCLFYMSGRRYEDIEMNYFVFSIIGIFVLLSIGIIIYRFKDKLSLKKITNNKLIYCYLILFLAMMLSIINSNYKTDTLFNSLHYLTSIIIFVVGCLFIDLSDENDRIKFLHSFILICIMIFFQYAIFVIERYVNNDFASDYEGSKNIISVLRYKNNILIGWSHPNHCLILYNMTVAMCIYLFITSKNKILRILYASFVLFTLLISFIVMSRGGLIGFVIIAAVYAIYFAIINKKFRKWFIIACSGLASLAILLIIILAIKGKFNNFDLESFSSDRSSLWKLGFDTFKENVVFGYGVGTSQHYIFDVLGRTESNYHSYVPQILQAGIVGALSFLVYLCFLVKNTFNKNLFNIMLSSMVYMFILWGLYDTLFFNMRIEPFFILLMPNLGLFENKKIDGELSENII